MESAGAANIFQFSQPISDRMVGLPASARAVPSPVEEPSVLHNALHSIWENANEGMRLTDQTGAIVAVNPAFCALVGMKEPDLVGQHYSVIYQAGEVAEQLRLAYETKFRSGSIRTRYEKAYTLHSGKILEVEVVTSFVDADDGARYLLAQFRDISGQRLTQKALVDSEAKYRRLFANSVQPMFESSIEGKIINANRAMLKLLGYDTMLELAELDIERDIYASREDRDLVVEALKLRGYITNTELKLRRRNGKIITVIEHARAVLDVHGTVIGFEGILEDVTARKAMEHKIQQYLGALEESKKALAELNAQKDKLFSILSHDLRSPFSSILGFCDLLRTDSGELTEKERREFLGYIEDAARDQLDLVNQLLDWSRLETGRIRMEMRDVDVKAVAEKSVTSLLGLARQKGVALDNALPDGVIVRGDASLLYQVFSNLIGNALKFTPEGGTISIALERGKDGDPVVAVHDTGVGIPPSDKAKLFKVEEKYTRKGLRGEKGTGLGLPVVHEIMQKHNAEISVESEVGTGTTFYLRFPTVQPAAGLSVLIADDEPAVRVLHSRFVRKWLPTATILSAQDGREALDLARAHHPAVVLTDYDMPEIDGFDLIRLLREDPATKGIPVVVITGHDSHASHEALLLSGAADILQKPVTPDRVGELLWALSLPVQAGTPATAAS